MSDIAVSAVGATAPEHHNQYRWETIERRRLVVDGAPVECELLERTDFDYAGHPHTKLMARVRSPRGVFMIPPSIVDKSMSDVALVERIRDVLKEA